MDNQEKLEVLGTYLHISIVFTFDNGSGAFGKVLKTYCKKTHKFLALKF